MSSSSDDEDNKLARSSDSDSESERRHRKKKKSKDKSKHKKHKKHSKKHKKHKRRRSTSSESSESEEEEWVSKEDVELKSTQKDNESSSISKPEFLKPPVERDEWMMMETLIPTFSNDSKKAKRQKEKEEARGKSSIEQLGQTSLELNPYWKDGGTGLPTISEEALEKQQQQPPSTISTPVGDGGIHWLKKQFQRAKEQAAEEGRSLEDVAADRWGSLENFFHMLEAAEEKAKHLDRKKNEGDDSRHKSRDHNRRRYDDNDDDNDRYRSRNSSHRNERFQRPRDSDSDEDKNDRISNSDRDRHRNDRSSDYKSSERRDRDRGRDRRSYKEDDYKSRIQSSASSSTGGWRKPESKSSSTATINAPENSKTIQRPSPSKIPKLNEQIKNLEQEEEVEEETEKEEEVKLLSENEMNQLCAKILKAEIMGNQTLIENLKAQKAAAEKAKKEYEERGGSSAQIQGKKKVIVKVILDEQKGAGPRRKIKEKPGETHNKEGQRVRYFPDDDRQSLKNMFESEKRNTVENENALFSRLAGKSLKSTNEDYDLDDIFADKASSSKQSMKEKEREVKDILYEEKMYKKTLENCPWCFEGNKLPKNLVISVAEKSILCLPPYQSLTEGHCLIIPYSHVSCSTDLDEDVWDEIQKFRKALVKMFADSDQDVVIFESALFLKKSPHMYLECVPMPKEIGELAPIYFKKAIQECETEWAQNKKLIELKNRDVRRAVPKGLPYFSVDFGYDSGFAHVVEDEKNFPRNFAQEILGGMMELDHGAWRKQKQDDFKTQRSKVMNFLKIWGPYDWTR